MAQPWVASRTEGVSWLELFVAFELGEGTFAPNVAPGRSGGDESIAELVKAFRLAVRRVVLTHAR
eukprot:4066085-Alexandrium_andersonii.AAC.1